MTGLQKSAHPGLQGFPPQSRLHDGVVHAGLQVFCTQRTGSQNVEQPWLHGPPPGHRRLQRLLGQALKLQALGQPMLHGSPPHAGSHNGAEGLHKRLQRAVGHCGAQMPAPPPQIELHPGGIKGPHAGLQLGANGSHRMLHWP